MTLEEFRKSVESEHAPGGDLDPALQALWWDARGDWVHAYLHRKEGDEGNASHWYSRAGKPKPTGSLDDEWRSIADALLG